MENIRFPKNTPKEVIEKLECPKCYEIIQPPIFLCNNGHPVCIECRPPLNRECLHCDTQISDTRCKELEKLYYTLKLKIACVNYGCTFKAEEGEMFRHLNKCSFQLVTCLDPMCQWEGATSQLDLHLEEKHNI